MRDAGPVNASESFRMMAVDANGRVFVTGQVDGGSPATLMATWKYNSDGTLAWGPKTYAPIPVQKSNYGVQVIPDEGGGCWVLGAVTKDGEGLNIVVVEYGSDGAAINSILWNNTLQNGDDYPVAMAFDGSGNLWVAGTTTGAGTGADYVVMGFSTAPGTFGNLIAIDRYNGPSNKTDTLVDMKVYPVSNLEGGGSTTGVTVTGTSFDDTTKNDIVTIHYGWDGTNFRRIPYDPGHPENEVRRFTDGGGATNQVAASLAIAGNSAGDIDSFVLGHSDALVNSVNLFNNILLLGYQTRSDTVPWIGGYNGGNDDFGVKVDAQTGYGGVGMRVYLTGNSWTASTNWYDVVVQAYDPDGAFQWQTVIDGATDDRAADLVAVPAGDVYLLSKRFNGSNYDYRTTNYSASNGAPIWTSPPTYWEAPYGGQEAPASIRYRITNSALLPEIYVSGRSQGAFENAVKYATVKYTQ